MTLADEVRQGAFDDDLDDLERALKDRRATLAPWDTLTDVVDLAQRVENAIANAPTRERGMAELVEVYQHLQRIEHPAPFVMEAVQAAKLRVMVGLGVKEEQAAVMLRSTAPAETPATDLQ